MYTGDKKRDKEAESEFRKGWRIDSYGHLKYFGYKREKESHNTNPWHSGNTKREGKK